MGQNRRWRKAVVDRVVPAAPRRVLDVAAGTAGVTLQLAKRTGAHVVGADLTADMLRRGMTNVAAAGAQGQVALVGGRAEQLPFPDRMFDAVTFAYLLRYVTDVEATLAELARVLRPGGVVAGLDFLLPPRRFWRFWWWWYTRLILPGIGWLVGGRAWFDVGRFLGPNISAHYRHHPVTSIVAAFGSAGFEDVGVRTMSLGGGLVTWGRRSGG